MIKVNDNAWKADYIVKSLSKIKYKSWELYVVSRFIHTLDDLDVEFVCQQLVSFFILLVLVTLITDPLAPPGTVLILTLIPQSLSLDHIIGEAT